MFSHLWVDEDKCAFWIDAISQYRQEWDEKRGMFQERPFHNWASHGADVHRYAAVVEDKMQNDKPQSEPLPPTPPTSRYEGTMDPFGDSDPLIGDIKKW